MKYGTEVFTTPDAVADALMTFSASLRSIDHGILVTVPTYEPGEGEGSISLVLGPGIPLSSRPSVSEVPDPEAADIIDHLTTATLKRTAVSVVVPGHTGPDNSPPAALDVILGEDRVV
ncbi:hypothetical protein B5808_17980 [Cnuibacter physcomitrellae]|uniref:Uncharacterized protein n=1 Tax=Cnuibacter physcomitrellae TaxID=1619308 RepID=A0A1X9LNV7_9MICO|nr:hypothetical protein B5808_17980 [Cnuibacter physcomitrellae]